MAVANQTATVNFRQASCEIKYPDLEPIPVHNFPQEITECWLKLRQHSNTHEVHLPIQQQWP